MKTASEMPSRIIDVISCNDKSRWKFITSIEINKPKHYFPNGKCVYCELEAIKEREKDLIQAAFEEKKESEAKLKAQLETQKNRTAYILEFLRDTIDEIECRGDEDCDHCIVKLMIEDGE